MEREREEEREEGERKNLIANEGFELFSGQADDGEEDVFEGWRSGLKTYAVSGGHSGEYAARLDNSAGAKTVSIFQTHRLKEGQEYVMSAYVKAEKEGAPFMLFSVGAEYQFKAATREWKRYEISGQGDGQWRQMQVVLPRGSIILIDDVRFEVR